MVICKTAETLADFLQSARSASFSIGFAPTMGALHYGHLSLIEAALRSTDLAVASIFVNRSQFNEKSDFDKYPRMPESDVEMLEQAGCNVLYMPDESDVFPQGWIPPTFNTGPMSDVMEGEHRPGHFKGMLKVVYRLFEIVKPDEAFFGEKDFQQLTLIRRMAAEFYPSLTVTGCPTIREADGLAMSSRNALLSAGQRAEAPVIFRTLQEAALMLKKQDIFSVKQFVQQQIDSSNYFRLQYFEIVDEYSLQPVTDMLKQRCRMCIAVTSYGPRLIDNIAVNF